MEFSFIKYLISHFSNSIRSKETSKSFSNSRNNLLLLKLIIHNWDLFSIRIFKLSSYKRISRNNKASLRKSIKNYSWNQRSYNQHSSIRYFLITSSRILTSFWYLRIFHQHIHSWYSILSKFSITIIFIIISIFWSNITCLHTWI